MGGAGPRIAHERVKTRRVTRRRASYGLKTGVFDGGGNLVFNRFTGPGRVGIQSGYEHLPTEN